MLKKLFALSLVVGLLGLTTGCPSKDKDKKKTEVQTEVKNGKGEKKTAKLELLVPKDLTIKQGGEETLKIEIKRENTTEDVTVKFDKLPKGVELKDKDKDKIPGDKTEGEFVFKADGDAQVVAGHKAEVSVVDATGKLKPDPQNFKVTVKELKEKEKEKDKEKDKGKGK
jgi:hypothetical protein